MFLTIKRKNHCVIVNKITLNIKDPEYSKEITNFRNKVNLPTMITNLTEYHDRNLVIFQIVKFLAEKDRRILF